ncbi:hypothetical protein MHM98_17760 [Psychrobium sp. MM17-31]|uniref:DUF6602 domain-containing protein n=1 Tax=Psychrobium sp. MM17-31 TaxID=2917758 RepID=UPI001EF68F6B|nr:DUF6602 domain-containing protein [Psychrobium sp. MM17-31]MCG7533178.1 hypothetical protein [Psychrobium sp. MM17-31]
MSDKTYGMVGWEEFSTNRLEILQKFNQAKIKGRSKKVKVEHGNVAEASIREWLESYLPKKYSVTSGYIIPDFVEINDPYNLGHFDVIIYDSFESPILWVDENSDKSDQGKSRAIPAQYVICVLEIKSSFKPNTSKDVIDKLHELTPMKKFLPKNFSCGAIFIELDENNINKAASLEKLNVDTLPHGFFGGLVMYSKIDPDLIGYISYYDNPKDSSDVENMPKKPLIIAGKRMDVFQGTPSDSIYVGKGFSVKATAPNRGSGYHFNKTYSAYSVSNTRTISLQWSTDSFVTFAIDLIGRFEGINPMSGQSSKYIFGQVFDRIPKKKDSDFPEDGSYLVVKQPDDMKA